MAANFHLALVSIFETGDIAAAQNLYAAVWQYLATHQHLSKTSEYRAASLMAAALNYYITTGDTPDLKGQS
jgi:hypothetical protein